MRIISGDERGRKLRALPGEDTRPTSDRVKETMFNILQFRLEGRRVLDLFAGTGQLGAEALSRGARECVFVEQANTAAAVIRENTRFFGERAVVRVAEVLRFLENETSKYDIVLLDPPYKTALLYKTLGKLFERDIISDGGCIICECDPKTVPSGAPPPYDLVKVYEHGKLLLYEKGSAE